MKVAVMGGGSTYTPELPAEPLSPACFGLLAHPLGPSVDRAQAVLDDLLTTHRAHLPQFWS
jgi:alpha-galactosidase/6-phospho-beta-glucosidase family protein